jgi:hypothetical protein
MGRSVAEWQAALDRQDQEDRDQRQAMAVRDQAAAQRGRTLARRDLPPQQRHGQGHGMHIT